MNTLCRGVSIGLLAALITGFFSCASNYRSLRPESIRYNQPLQNNPLEFGYMYGILSQTRNKKYARKEDKRGIDLVAVRLTNNTDQNIVVRDDIQFYAGGSGIFPIDNELVRKDLRQGVPIYLLYSLLVVNTYNCQGFNCDVDTYPVGIVIAGLNMIVAGTANKKFGEELERYNIMDAVIAPGKTVYGLVGLQSMGYAPLTVQLK